MVTQMATLVPAAAPMLGVLIRSVETDDHLAVASGEAVAPRRTQADENGPKPGDDAVLMSVIETEPVEGRFCPTPPPRTIAGASRERDDTLVATR